jgi:RepB DNA-primase from phage plasmid
MLRCRFHPDLWFSESVSRRRSTGGAVKAAEQALELLDVFASVGVGRFDLTLTDIAGVKVGFRGNRSLDQLRVAMPGILEAAAREQHNVIVRPRSAGAKLIQLDDLGEEAAGRLAPVSFLALRTSTGSFQAWVAVADGDADFARRLLKKTGADLTASGATRVSGSFNFKEKYRPVFPVIETVHLHPGKVVTRAELEALGMVSPAERPVPGMTPSDRRRPETKGWPSYRRCLENAPMIRGGDRPDISRADFTFCLLAIDWGWSVEETANRLMEESSKASENGQGYALRTARAAARVVEGRTGWRR